jgi:coenzyme F420-reducing hydrogenase delta subunit/ferredoxin
MSARAEVPRAAAGNGFEPKITAFVCNWCTYLGADLAGTNRLEYPPNVRLIRLPCTGRIDFNLVVKAFEIGSDAVLVSGCHPGDCHYTAGNYHARRRWMLFRPLLETLGFDLRRLHFTWISAAEGKKFQEVISTLTDQTRQLGPYQYPGTSNGRKVTFENMGARPAVEVGAGVEERMREQARELLSSGTVNVVIGYSERGKPLFVTSAEEAGRLAWNERCRLNLTVYLKRKEVRTLGRAAVVVSESGNRTLNVLAKESQVEPDSGPVPIMPALPAARPETGSLDALLRLDACERMAYWAEEFSRCTRCYACRQICPLCYCERCVADRNRPQVIDTSPHIRGNFSWHITRAFHVAGRCTECGNCTEACPSGINLGLLCETVSRAAIENFTYRPGVDPEAEPLLGSFSLQDKEDFIR